MSHHASGWSEDHHRWIVSDAVEYMLQSGDPMMQWAADWLRTYPGRNSLLREQGDNWHEDPLCKDGSFAALCALRNEAANTDWYSDMSMIVDQWEAFWLCQLHIATTMLSPEVATLLTWKQSLACTFLAYEAEPVLNFPVLTLIGDELGLDLEPSHPMSYHLTSFNHMMGVRYDNDETERDYSGVDPICTERDHVERLGYKFKFLGQDCNSASEGDCADENMDMAAFALLDDLSFLHIDPGTGPNCAGTKYRNVTCHEHDGCQTGMTIAESRYFPMDNIAEYWMKQWERDVSSEKADIVKLGPVLHVSQDAFEPHHIYNFIGRGHHVFESWALGLIENRQYCRDGGAASACAYEYLENTLFDPSRVSTYLEQSFNIQFDIMQTGEEILSTAARRAALWHIESGDEDFNASTYLSAMQWNAQESEIYSSGENDVDYYNKNSRWDNTLAMGHNLAVASTVTMLKKAFTQYKAHWANQGYCGKLHDQDETTWLQTLPGPWAGASLSPLDPAEAHYISVLGSDENMNTAESAHPYYNDVQRHPSNEVTFHLQYLPMAMFDTETDRVVLVFDQDSDWHYAAEGDHIEVMVQYFDMGNDLLEDDWHLWGSYDTPQELLAQPLVISGFPFGKRLAKVKVELVQGTGDVFLSGTDGFIARLNDQGLDEMWSGTTDSINGLWGSSDGDIFASTYANNAGTILHYDGSANDDWTAFERPSLTWGFRHLWGLDAQHVYAVGDDLVGYIWQYDGSDWSEIYRYGMAIYHYSIRDIWGDAPDRLFAVGGEGAVHFFDGQNWSQQLVGDRSDLNGVWGASESDVYAVGDGGHIWHFDGATWEEMDSGTTRDLHAVWGERQRVFAVGDNGLVLQLGTGIWQTMPTPTNASLYDIWGSQTSNIYAVGQAGTLLHFDGQSWGQIATGTSQDLLSVWGATPSCTPEPKFGFRITTAHVSYHQTGRTPPNSDCAQIAEELAVWLQWLMDGGGYSGLGVIWDCAPGSPCDEDLQNNLQGLFQPYSDQNIALEVEQVFDLVQQALAETMPNKEIHPSLVAIAVVDAVYGFFPSSLAESKLTNQAIGWALDRQAMKSSRPGKGVLHLSAQLDFDKQREGRRPPKYSADGSALPGVSAPDTQGYPGFREMTDEEKETIEGMTHYMMARRDDIGNYAYRNRIERILGNIEARRAILNTYSGSDPASSSKVEEMNTILDRAQAGLELTFDDDGDGVPGLFDACPDTCARGLDVDRDGCLDHPCLLEERLADLEMWWVPKMVLSMRARLACAKATNGKPKPAAAQLRALKKQVSAYARAGWIDKKVAKLLIAYADNARKVVLGDFDDLQCD